MMARKKEVKIKSVLTIESRGSLLTQSSQKSSATQFTSRSPVMKHSGMAYNTFYLKWMLAFLMRYFVHTMVIARSTNIAILLNFEWL